MDLFFYNSVFFFYDYSYEQFFIFPDQIEDY